jgi:hypothetical protein
MEPDQRSEPMAIQVNNIRTEISTLDYLLINN